ncbi:MAG: uracil-DNA glycosylase [Anaerolineae bacterium]|nr:uracil-DNA glycosylase [Anaerolineae bacterium]
MIAESAPENTSDGFYAKGRPLYLMNTIQAFRDAGAPVNSLADILELGVYMTTAIKCAKTAYTIQANTIKNCSYLLEKELALFPRTRTYLLMGHTAAQAINYIAARAGEPQPVPDVSTSDLRKQDLWFRGRRVFLSYAHTHASYPTEVERRKAVAQDIIAALRFTYGTRPLSG